MHTVESRIGQVLEGKYELQRLLGAGGMGSVYAARHKLINRKVAIKLLNSEYSKDEETVRRFQQEARIATAIGHDHIVEVTDMGRTDRGEMFLVMEFLDGADLSTVLEREGRLSARRTCHICIQALAALEAAHATGIVHRDLKPANIFLTARSNINDYVKIVDFGISKVREAIEGMTRSGMTRAGDLVGTPLYMSPEQARGDVDITPAADIYAMGVILFEMLTGRLPFLSNDLPTLLQQILQAAPPDAAALQPDIPAPLSAAIRKALAKAPRDRFANAAELRRALSPFSPQTSALAGLKTTRISARVDESSGPARGQRQGFDVDVVPGVRAEDSSAVRTARKISTVVIGVLAGLAGLLLIAAAILVALRFVGTGEKPSPVPAQLQNAAVPALVPLLSANTAPAPQLTKNQGDKPAPTRDTPCKIRVVVSPPAAAVLLDGRQVGTGTLELRPTCDGMEHEIAVLAEGHTPFSQKVLFQGEALISATLERLVAERRHRSSRTPASAQGVAPRRPSGGQAPENEPAKPAQAESKPAKPGRDIDEAAPW